MYRYILGGTVGVLAFLILGVFSLSIADHYALRSGSLASVISAVLVDLTNVDRSADELSALTVNPVLTAAAQAKADDMASKGYFAHVSPDGVDSWYWFRQQKYTFLYAGENLAVDFSDSVDVERAWMNSLTHRANILNDRFTEIGIATAQGTFQGRPTTFVVQMFGTPSIKPDVVLGKPAKVQTVSSPAEPTVPALATAVSPAPKVATSTSVLGTKADSILPASTSWWQKIMASPKTMLKYAYYALAIIILILLAYVTELEFHKRHMRHVTAAVLLFVLMIGLFVLANATFFSQPIIVALR